MLACLHCSSARTHKDGHDRAGTQRHRSSACQRSSTDRTGTPFTNHRWPRDVIVTAVRWYFSYRLSATNVRNLLAERGLDVSRQTVADWVQKFGVLLAEAGRRHAKPLRMRWFVDETYVRVGKQWVYLYRAVSEAGQVVDVLLHGKRDLDNAEAFFEQAIKRHSVVPDEVVTDKHRAYFRAVKLTTKPIERSHVFIKDRVRPMRSLGSVETGQCLLEGIELAQAVQRGDICLPNQFELYSVHARARLEVTTFSWLASGLRTAA